MIQKRTSQTHSWECVCACCKCCGNRAGAGDRKSLSWMWTCPQFSHFRLSSTPPGDQPSPFVSLVPENHFLKFSRKMISPLLPRCGEHSHMPSRDPEDSLRLVGSPWHRPQSSASPRACSANDLAISLLLFESLSFLRSDRSVTTSLFTFHLPEDRGLQKTLSPL